MHVIESFTQENNEKKKKKKTSAFILSFLFGFGLVLIQVHVKQHDKYTNVDVVIRFHD